MAGGRRLPIGSRDDARLIVVSVHDVAPSTATGVAWLRSRLDDLGVQRRVLKVIPNERGEHRVDTDLALADALRAEQTAGGEIVLHGWTHLADPRPGPGSTRRSPVDLARARLFAGQAAEFLGLSEGMARGRILAGRALLEGIGLRIDGFCAPGWLAGPGVAPVLREAGFRYLVSYGRVVDLESGRRHLLPGFGSMGTDDLQEWLVAAEGGLVLTAAAWLPVIRVFVHPQGAPTSAACARTLRAIGQLRRTRRPTTFRELLDRWATARPGDGAAA